MATTQRGKVRQVLASGIVLELEDGREGFLPRRAFTHLTTRDLRQAVELHQEFEVTAEDSQDHARRVNVTLASQDFWEAFRTQYPPGSILRGVVSGTEAYGYFIDLMPGVTGLAPTAELSNDPLDPDEPPLLPGDGVLVQVQSINRTDRHVRLSLRAAAQERRLTLERAETPKPAAPPAFAPGDPSPENLSLRVLVVDDDSQLRADILERTRAWGHQPSEARSFTDARAALDGGSYDILLLDIHLGDGLGLELAEQLLSQKTRARIILMTDAGTAALYEPRIAALAAQGVTQILKIDYPDKLEQVLVRTDPTPFRADASRSDAARQAKEGEENAADGARTSLDAKLDRILRDLRRQTGAASAILFGLDEMRQQLDIIKRPGIETLNERELATHWRFSPIRDALEDGAMAFAEDARAGKEAARFQYLLRVLTFASVIGTQVIGEPRGALFVFHPEPRRFRKGQIQLVRAAAERISAAQEIEKTQSALAESQRFILLGQFSATVVHEVNNKVGRVRAAADGLPRDLQELERRTREGSSPDQLNALWLKVQQRSTRLDVASKEVVKTISQYDSLSRQTDMARWDAHEILEKALAFSAPYASEMGVTLHQQFQHPSPEVRTVAAWLQQAVLNTLLNAIQNIHDKKKGQGNVLLATSAAPQDAPRSLQIRICDDGPGIHTAVQERIFDFGFSTRKRGSGIGLYISRRLIESLGGRILVEESYPLWGTTILIELPTVEHIRKP